MKLSNNPGSRRVRAVREELRRNTGTLFCIGFLLIVAGFSVFAFLLPNRPNTIDTSHIFQAPTLRHPFGTDELGRDYLTRTIYGGRISLLIGLLSMCLSTFIGVVAGTVSGYFGGVIDNVLMRLVDVMSSIPQLILIIVAGVFLRPGFQTICLVIGLLSWMEMARLVRAETLTVKEREYVLYAVASSERAPAVILRHIIPSILPTILVCSTTSIANAILTESSLSFLGLGVQQPMSSWGSLLQNAQQNLQSAPYMAILPGLLIVLTIFSFNRLGELLRLIAEPQTALQKG